MYFWQKYHSPSESQSVNTKLLQRLTFLLRNLTEIIASNMSSENSKFVAYPIETVQIAELQCGTIFELVSDSDVSIFLHLIFGIIQHFFVESIFFQKKNDNIKY